MIMMKTLILSTALLLGSAGAAQAAMAADANVPLCSKTVTDECMNPSQAPKSMLAKPHHATKAVHRHHARKPR
jgi:hypothetical protein